MCDVQVKWRTGSFALGVDGVTRVTTGGAPGHPLQNQTRLADDDARADVVM